jgi:hypothetical protein
MMPAGDALVQFSRGTAFLRSWEPPAPPRQGVPALVAVHAAFQLPIAFVDALYEPFEFVIGRVPGSFDAP